MWPKFLCGKIANQRWICNETPPSFPGQFFSNDLITGGPTLPIDVKSVLWGPDCTLSPSAYAMPDAYRAEEPTDDAVDSDGFSKG